MLYVNFVIVCYLAFFLPVYVSISVTALVEVDFFSSVALTTNPLILSIWNLFYGSLIVKTFADRERVVFWNWPLPVHFVNSK